MLSKDKDVVERKITKLASDIAGELHVMILFVYFQFAAGLYFFFSFLFFVQVWAAQFGNHCP